MNIFASDKCPIKSAQNLANVHVVKMLNEGIQLLSTAHYILDGNQVGMKPTHLNHPASIWCRTNKSNYSWLLAHTKALCDEYTHRYGKVHKSSIHLLSLSNYPVSIEDGELSEFVRCMPDEFKLASLLDPCKSYQLYLKSKYNDWTTRTEKRRMKVEWTGRNKPHWIED